MGRTVGEALVGLLEDYGIDTVFGIPGTHSIELYRGLENSKIRHISPRHEQGGGFMADGYARLSGRPAACFVITGPGVTNLSTPMGQAYSDSTPMLVISPVNPADVSGGNIGRLHEIKDQTTVTQDLAAFSKVAPDQAVLRDLVHDAFTVFSSERPAPAHIHIPLPLFKEEADGNWTARNVPGPQEPDETGIADAVRMIDAAERPIIILGGGIARDREAALALVEALNVPAVLTANGKGTLPVEHPLNLGSTLTATATQDLLASCDVLIALGTELSNTDYWREDLVLPEKKVVVNLDPDLLERMGPESVCIQAGAAETAHGLAKAVSKRAENPLSADCDKVRRELAQPDLTDKQKTHRAVLDTIRNALPANASVFTDMTQIAYSGNAYYPSEMFGSWFHPTGYGTLGYGLPAAMGAKLAEPDRPVVALVGDAGFQYTLQEMALAEEISLPVILIMWNNNALQQIADDMTDSDIANIGVVQKNPDFQMLAKAYGWAATYAGTIDELAAAIKTAVASDGPSFIEVRDPDIRASIDLS